MPKNRHKKINADTVTNKEFPRIVLWFETQGQKGHNHGFTCFHLLTFDCETIDR